MYSNGYACFRGPARRIIARLCEKRMILYYANRAYFCRQEGKGLTIALSNRINKNNQFYLYSQGA